MAEYDVTVDRNMYIGGSDLAIIMGISPFKKRWDLLLEKAGLKENDFTGNKYTVFGQELEPYIRNYVNDLYLADFQPNRVYDNDIRCHTDGYDPNNGVLEIKTTSHIYDTAAEYQIYLVQLLKYMEVNKTEKGILAVYQRPENFDTTFDKSRLRIFHININNYADLLKQINTEIDRFRADLKRLKENPLLSEQDFQPAELVQLSNKVVALEKRMAEYKSIEKEYKDMKQALYEAMDSYNVKSWETYNGTKITKVEPVQATSKTSWEFDVDKFAEENDVLYRKYLKKVEKKTAKRSGYVKITLPKEV